MKKISMAAVLFVTVVAYSQNVQQQLVVTQNDGTIGGLFKVAVQMKATGLTGNNTLNGATVDVQFDTTKLSIPLSGGAAFFSKVAWNPLIVNGEYTKTASRYVLSNVTYIRIAPVGSGINGFSTFGWDLTASYQTIATITFALKDNTVFTDLSIFTSTNGCKLFDSPGNSNLTAGFISPTIDPTLGIINVQLPVELVNFTALARGRNIDLSWGTKTELNNYGFDVERKAVTSEQSTLNSWTKVGFVDGKGTTNAPQSYKYSDAVKSAGTFTYRLKQTDRDGKFTYSAQVEAKSVLTADDYKMSQNYPNPFNPSTKFNFAVSTPQHVSVKVFNSMGQEVQTLFNGIAPADQIQEVTFDGARLASGIYFYVLRTQGRVEVKKMMMMK